jgi:hypothetical protein
MTGELKQLDAAVDDLAALDVAGGDAHHTADMLVDLRRVRARLAAVEARLVDRIDTARPWADHGYRTTATWLASADNTSLDDARGRVRLGRRLRTMPATAAALAAGDISATHAQRLAGLIGPATAAAFAEAEVFLVGQARSMRWADFTKACTYWARAARNDRPDPDTADHEHRHVSLTNGLRGTGLLSGELTAVAKASVASELDRLERQLFEADWAAAKAVHGEATTASHLPRTPRQRRHDALVEMARRSATAPADGKRPRPLVSVLAGYDAFSRICELADGTVLGYGTVARLLGEADIERIVFDGPGRVLDLGRTRSFTGAARRAVEIADRHCQGPGCHVPAERCDIDHTWRWADGGPTRPDNGHARCGPHNRQREHPPPRSRRVLPQRSPEQRKAHLELLRARIADRVRHDPAWGYSTTSGAGGGDDVVKASPRIGPSRSQRLPAMSTNTA